MKILAFLKSTHHTDFKNTSFVYDVQFCIQMWNKTQWWTTEGRTDRRGSWNSILDKYALNKLISFFLFAEKVEIAADPSKTANVAALTMQEGLAYLVLHRD